MEASAGATLDKSADPGDGVLDPIVGKACHQCRQKIKNSGVICQNQKKNKPCAIKLCKSCLVNRYGEKVEEVKASENWSCPKCKGICNCSICMRRRGHQPTGPLTHKAKEKRYSSVSEMLVKEPELLDHAKVGEAAVDSLPNEEGAISPVKRERENASDGIADANGSDSAENSSKKVKQAYSEDVGDGITSKKKKEGLNSCDEKSDEINCEEVGEIGNNNDEAAEDSEGGPEITPPVEITLPVGSELTIVAGIELPAKDVGNALQFLEFFFTFGKLLVVRKGLPEQVLHDLFYGRSARRGQYSMTVQLHMQLLSELQPEDEEIAGEESPDYERVPWFQKLKDCLSETQKMLKLPVLDSLEKAIDYENLDASEKLMILNILCDELLGTEKVRNFINNENAKFTEKVKEARKKKRDLMRKMKTITEEAVIPKEGDSITIPEQAEGSSDKSVPAQAEASSDKSVAVQAEVSSDKSVVAQAEASSDKSVAAQAETSSDKSVAAQAEASSDRSVAAQDNANNVVDSNEDMLLKGNPTCDAVRTDPVFVDPRGHAYWKLNCLEKNEILVQDIGLGDGTSTFDEKWSVLDAEEQQVVENHVSSVKKQRRKRGPRKV